MLYRIQLKQGSRTYVERGEFKSIQHVLTFYQSLCTCQVSEIWGGAGYKDTTLPPIDDMSYYPLVKMFAQNEQSQKQDQIVIRNVKLTKSSEDISAKIIECMEIDGLKVDSTYCGLFKESKLAG